MLNKPISGNLKVVESVKELGITVVNSTDELMEMLKLLLQFCY